MSDINTTTTPKQARASKCLVSITNGSEQSYWVRRIEAADRELRHYRFRPTDGSAGEEGNHVIEHIDHTVTCTCTHAIGSPDGRCEHTDWARFFGICIEPMRALQLEQLEAALVCAELDKQKAEENEESMRGQYESMKDEYTRIVALCDDLRELNHDLSTRLEELLATGGPITPSPVTTEPATPATKRRKRTSAKERIDDMAQFTAAS